MSINIGGPGVATTLVGQEEARWYNRTGGARLVGDVMQLDLAQTATETTGYVQGDGSSVFENAVLPEAGMEGYGTFGIVLEGDLGDNEAMNMAREGIVLANIAEAVGPGDALIVVAASDELARGDGSTGQLVVAVALETIARAGQAYVWLRGLSGGHGVDGAAVATVSTSILRGKFTTAGSTGATESFTLTGCTATHVIVATIEDDGTDSVTLVLTVPDTDRATLTFSADPRDDTIVNIIAIPRA